MKQRAHAWVALRALKMLDDVKKTDEEVRKLTEMLSFYLSDVWDGAWLPDIRIRDMKYGHIYKMDSDPRFIYPRLPSQKRYKKSYSQLKKHLVGNRLCLKYIKGFDELKIPYRTHPKLSGHLPNRVIALTHMIGDMLKMSNYPLEAYVQNGTRTRKEYNSSGVRIKISKKKIKDLSKSPNFSTHHIALVFFLLSHYICDAHMPLHCDLRDYSIPSEAERRIPRSLHPWIEKYWENNFPSKEKLILTDYTLDTLDEVIIEGMPADTRIKIDKNGSQYKLKTKVEKNLKGDVWEEMVYISRVSYAVARKWMPITADWDELKKHSFKTYRKFKQKVSDEIDFGDGMFAQNFNHVTNCIFHDAVEAVARIWYIAWKRFLR